MVCAALSSVVIVQTAGGARPLAVFVAGFGADAVAVLDAPDAPSDWVAGVVPGGHTVVPPDVVPVAAAAAFASCVADAPPLCADAPSVEDCAFVAVGTTAVLDPSVAAAVDASTVPVSVLPIVAVASCGAGDCEEVSAGAVELAAGVLVSCTENQPIPLAVVSAPVVAAGGVGASVSAGAVVVSVAAVVSVVATAVSVAAGVD